MPNTTTETPTATLDHRRRAAGLSVAALARLAQVRYSRCWMATTGGAQLTEDEMDRIEYALAQAQRGA